MTGIARVRAYDAIRGLAIIAVGVIHTCGFAWNPKEDSSALIPYLLTRQISGFAVPLFVFLSGYLLGRHEFKSWHDYSRFLQKRIMRLIPPYLVWSFVAVGIDMLQGKTWDGMELAHALLYGRVMVPFYFVPMIMQLYISLPIWSFLAHRRWLNIAFALVISGGTWCYYLWLGYEHQQAPPWWYMLMAGSWLIYFVLGVELRRHGVPKLPASRTLSAVICVLGLVAGSFIAVRMWTDGLYVLSTSSLRWDSAVMCIALIWWLMLHIEQLEKAPRWLVWLGRNSFFAYLTHAFVLHLLGDWFITMGWRYEWPYLKIALLVTLCLGLPAWASWQISKRQPHGILCRWLGAGS